MKVPQTRRDFLTEVGKGRLVTAVGASVASDLGLGLAHAEEASTALTFGDLEPLVAFMQETPADKLAGGVIAKIKAGTELRQLVAAAASRPRPLHGRRQ